MKGILFLCVANSARSQMAEGLARQMAPSDFGIFSAGSAPSRVNPYAIQAMEQVGVDLSGHRSKSIDSISHDDIDTVITLCAEEVCPVFPHPVEKHHWPHPDPAATKGSPEEILQSFCDVRDQIQQKLRAFFSTRFDS